MKEDKIGRKCGTCGERRNVYRVLVGQTVGKRPLKKTYMLVGG
jgi:hypothetical protein